MIPGVNLEELILAVGLIGLFAIIFAESGLLIGFFLPGDSLLLTAGVLSAAHPDQFPIWLVCAVCFVAAVTGDAVGYWFGKQYGRRLYERPDSRLLQEAPSASRRRSSTSKHGGKTIVIARFLPFVRTFAPIVAGAAHMNYRRFAVYNFTGAALWAIGVTMAGYLLGSIIPAEVLDRWLYIIIAVVIGLSVLPTAMHIYRAIARRSTPGSGRGGRRGATPQAQEVVASEGPK